MPHAHSAERVQPNEKKGQGERKKKKHVQVDNIARVRPRICYFLFGVRVVPLPGALAAAENSVPNALERELRLARADARLELLEDRAVRSREAVRRAVARALRLRQLLLLLLLLQL